jgi:hypothetical protein
VQVAAPDLRVKSALEKQNDSIRGGGKRKTQRNQRAQRFTKGFEDKEHLLSEGEWCQQRLWLGELNFKKNESIQFVREKHKGPHKDRAVLESMQVTR